MIEAHILSHDDERMLPYAVRHYIDFCDRVVVHDGGPTGKQCRLDVMLPVDCVDRVSFRTWDTAGELNDELARQLKNECWRKPITAHPNDPASKLRTDADWVICVDADELLWFPSSSPGQDRADAVRHALYVYEKCGAAIIRPHGFEMFSETWPDPDENSLITDVVKDGAPDDKWYSKPVLFSPRRVAESGFGIGAHEARPVLHSGRALCVDSTWPFADPPAYLLHCHHIGPIELVAQRYDATRTRLARVNVARGWGNFEPGIDHARRKRASILPGLGRVID